MMVTRPKCSVCRGKGTHHDKECEACFGKGYIEEWPTERLEREEAELRQLLVDVLQAVENHGTVPMELQIVIRGHLGGDNA